MLKIAVGSVIVSLDTSDPHEYAEIVYEGSPAEVESLREDLAWAGGAFGHLIGDRTTPIDLHYALIASGRGEIVEGHHIVKNYHYDVPDGAVT